jgi:hypothetical protein
MQPIWLIAPRSLPARRINKCDPRALSRAANKRGAVAERPPQRRPRPEQCEMVEFWSMARPLPPFLSLEDGLADTIRMAGCS